MNFDIRQHIEFNSQGRSMCPSCTLSKGANHKKLNLSLVPNTDGAYKCHAGCTPDEIRSALGAERNRIIPTALVANAAAAPVTVSPQKKRAAHEKLMESDGPAKQWLHQRGITDEMIARYELGIVRSKVGTAGMFPAISIPIPNHDGTAYYQKKRVAPWLQPDEQPEAYRPWVQKDIPAQVWFTWKPAEATATYLCEGEWDAMLLGWQLRQADKPIAVACFTCGCGTVPPLEQLDLLPGTVTVFYDRNDKPTKLGTIPGDDGARKVAAALGDRGRIAKVPMPENCDVKGWDVSDALNQGYVIDDFIRAAGEAVSPPPSVLSLKANTLRERLISNDELLERAPDYTDWLVPDLLTSNELFLLAASPRAGKSLLAMTLTHAVATGGLFLGRPVTKGGVIYIRCEDSESKTKEREQAQGWEDGLPVYWLDRFKLSELPQLREIAQELDPRLIVVDTISRVRDNASVSESSAEMSQVLEPLQELAQEMNCCILLVHHTGKVNIDTANQIDIFDTIRGSSAIRATCRGVLILAAGERNYRLCAENGWGKHDLNIVLDANTLTWRLLGNWNPTVNGAYRDQILDYLKRVQVATIDQMFIDLQIPKKSIYKTLERLQASDTADEKVFKEGKRRNQTYRLALYETALNFDAIAIGDTRRQSPSVSPSANADGVSDRCPKRQDLLFPESAPAVINDHLIDQIGGAQPDVYTEKQPSTSDTVSVSPYETAKRQGLGEMASTPDTEPVSRYETDKRQLGDTLGDKPKDRSRVALEVGDWVEICEGRFSGRRARVITIQTDGLIELKGTRWVVTQKYERSAVRFLERSNEV